LGPIWDAFYPWPLSVIGRWQERWTHWLYRNVQFWTANQSTRRFLEAHGVKSVKVIHYGVYTAALPVLPEKPLELPLRLAVVSRLAPNKRIDHAVRTVRCLLDRGIESRLVIVGTGEVEGLLRRLVDDLKLGDRVRFTGALDEAAKDEELRRAHFLLHNSMREGWGLNVIEANAMGTPGAVYPVAGLTESTLRDDTGIISEQETPQSLAAVLAEAFKSPGKYQAYRVSAWNRAKTLHWDHILPIASEWLEARAGGRLNR
jgi:glycosyltransferase involved in cell wall biosynthesis